MSSKIQTDSEYLKDGKQPALVDESSVVSYDTTAPPKFRKAMYLSAIVAAVGGFICGYDTGSISGILAMPQFTDNFFTEDNITYLQGLLLALYLMTAALGAFFSGFFCGKMIATCIHDILITDILSQIVTAESTLLSAPLPSLVLASCSKSLALISVLCSLAVLLEALDLD